MAILRGQSGMVKTVFMPEPWLEGGSGVFSSNQREEHMQRCAIGDHDGIFRKLQGLR